MQVKKQELEPDMEKQIGSKQGKEYVKAVYCHLAYNAGLDEAQAGIKIAREISIISDMQMTPLLWQKKKN